METKPWYTSKMLWTNFLTFVISLAVGLGFTAFGDYDLSDPVVVATVIPMILSVINFILRLVTKTGLE